MGASETLLLRLAALRSAVDVASYHLCRCCLIPPSHVSPLHSLLGWVRLPRTGPSVAPVPGADVTAALEKLVDGCTPLNAKAIAPTLYLAVGIMGTDLGVCKPVTATRVEADGSGADVAPTLPAATGCKGVTVRISLPTLPVAAGLGSSAAFSVATSAALLDLHSRLYGGCAAGLTDPDRTTVMFGSDDHQFRGGRFPLQATLSNINDWAFAAETLFHGRPSGLDNTVSWCEAPAFYSDSPPMWGVHRAALLCACAFVCVCVACVLFASNSYGGALAYVSHPKSIEHLQGMPPLRLLVTNTKVPKDTKALVAGVRVLYDKMPAVLGPVLAAIEAVSQTFVDTVKSGPPPGETVETRVASLVSINQSLLEALGVGHPALTALCAASRRCANRPPATACAAFVADGYRCGCSQAEHVFKANGRWGRRLWLHPDSRRCWRRTGKPSVQTQV